MSHRWPLKAHVHALLTVGAFALFWLPIIAFAAIADEVTERTPLPFDVPILGFLHALHTPALNNLFLFITTLGQPLVVGGAGAIVLVLLLAKRYYRESALLVTGLGGAVIANQLLKYVFARSRPDQFVAVITETSYSFPSGHAMVSAAAAGTLVIMLARTRFRTLAFVLGATATLAIGLSRVYLGVHYPSDVLAGWLAGFAWAVIAGSLIVDRPFTLGRRLTPGTLGA